MLKNQTTTRKRSSIKELHRLEIERVCLLNYRRARSVLVANQQVLFQVSASVRCDFFGIVNSFKAFFKHVLLGA